MLFRSLSASIGVAVYPRDGETMEALLQKADRELYGMKGRGPDQASLLAAVCIREPMQESVLQEET